MGQNNSRRCRSRTHPLHDVEITKDGQGAIRSKTLRSLTMNKTLSLINSFWHEVENLTSFQKTKRGDSVELSRFFMQQFFSQNTVLNNAK